MLSSELGQELDRIRAPLLHTWKPSSVLTCTDRSSHQAAEAEKAKLAKKEEAEKAKSEAKASKKEAEVAEKEPQEGKKEPQEGKKEAQAGKKKPKDKKKKKERDPGEARLQRPQGNHASRRSISQVPSAKRTKVEEAQSSTPVAKVSAPGILSSLSRMCVQNLCTTLIRQQRHRSDADGMAEARQESDPCFCSLCHVSVSTVQGGKLADWQQCFVCAGQKNSESACSKPSVLYKLEQPL